MTEAALAAALVPLLPGSCAPEHRRILTTADPVPEPSAVPAVVVLGDARQGMAAALGRVRGFPHVERLRILPGPAALRVVLPGALVREHLDVLVRPKTAQTSHAQRLVLGGKAMVPTLVVRAASRPVVVAGHRPAELPALLRALVPGADLAVVRNPANPDRLAVFGFAPGGRLAAVAKVASAAQARRRLEDERRMLEGLAASDTLGRATPRVLGWSGDALVTEALHGELAPTALTPSLRKWLLACRTPEVRHVAATAVVRRVVEDARRLAPAHPLLQAAAHAALDVTGTHAVPSSVVHGDFVPWNVLLGVHGPLVYDWERGSWDGLAGWDEVYWQLKVGVVMHGWRAADLVQAVRAGLAPKDAYPEREGRALALLVLVDLAVDAVHDGKDRARSELVEAIDSVLHSGLVPSAP